MIDEQPTIHTINKFHSDDKYKALVGMIAKCLIEDLFSYNEIKQAVYLSKKLKETKDNSLTPDIKIVPNSFDKPS